MKGFFIFLFLLVGSVVGLMAYYQEIGQWYMAKVVVDEGGPYPNATFDKIKAGNPDDFKARFEDDLGSRLKVAKFADILGKQEFFIKLAEETRSMYMGSSLEQKEGFDDMIFNLAEYYDQEDHYVDAYALFKIFITTYPDSKHMADVKRDADHLKFKYTLG